MKRIPIPLSQRFADFARGPLVFLVWASSAVTAGVLLMRQQAPIDHRGWVPTIQYEVTAPATGRLAQLLVRPMQRVRRGQLVGQLDTRPLEARLETARARVAELEEQLAFEQASVAARNRAARLDVELSAASNRIRWESEQRSYATDEMSLSLAVLALEVEQATDRVEVDRIDVRLERARQLASENVGPEAEVTDLELAFVQAEERIRRREAQLVETRAELEAARARRQEFEQLRPALAEVVELPAELASLRAAIRVQGLVVAELELEREGLLLVAPAEGQVAGLLASEGQTVVAGRAVLTVAATGLGEAVVYLGGEAARGELVGRGVVLTTLGEAPRRIESRIATAGPAIEVLPTELWAQPNVPEYGRPVRVPLGDATVLPGETFSATLEPPAAR